MSKEQALSRVASMLAYEAYQHIDAARDLPNMIPHTREALAIIRETAQALDILPVVKVRLSMYYDCTL